MSSHNASLNRILRAQLTAVHQQFVHILILRHCGLTETAMRIQEVDGNDFRVAMKIIDRLVSARHDIQLEPDPFEPGANEPAILMAEQAVERRLCTALLAGQTSEPHVQQLVLAALAPRKAYAEWLENRLVGLANARNPIPGRVDASAQVFACLIALIEQAMVHAFVHWHHGDRLSADAAWAASGAAMMQATGMVRWLAAKGAAPIPSATPKVQITNDPIKAIALDRMLAKECAERASRAAEIGHDGIASICSPIADYAVQLSAWEPGADHPAQFTNLPAFSSFEATLNKFVWSQ